MANKQPYWGQEKLILTGTIDGAIRAARHQGGLTQEQRAELAGIHRQWLGRWERVRDLPSSEAWTKLWGILKLLPARTAESVTNWQHDGNYLTQ